MDSVYCTPQDALRVYDDDGDVYDDPQELTGLPQRHMRSDSHVYASLSLIRGDRKRSIFDEPIDPSLRRVIEGQPAGSRTASYASLQGIREGDDDVDARSISHNYATLTFERSTPSDYDALRRRKPSATEYDTLRRVSEAEAPAPPSDAPPALPQYAKPIKKPKNFDPSMTTFSCVDCDAILEQYYVKDGAVYCPDDYRKRWGAKCDGCGQYMDEGGYAAGGKQFHADCLKCATCSVKISPTDGVFVGPRGIECSKCIRAGVGDCKRCGGHLEGEIVKSALGCFHVACFTCDTCKKAISGNHFGVGPAIICEACHTNAAAKCAQCREPITGRYTRVGEGQFHLHCVNCCMCTKRIFADDGSSLDPSLGALLVTDGKPCHAQCMACRKCGKVFGAGEQIGRTPDGGHLCVACL